MVQDLFPKGKESRTFSINAQCMVLFKNPRDNTQVVNLAKHYVSGSCKTHARGIQRRNVRNSRLPIRRLETVYSGTLAPAQ